MEQNPIANGVNAIMCSFEDDVYRFKRDIGSTSLLIGDELLDRFIQEFIESSSYYYNAYKRPISNEGIVNEINMLNYRHPYLRLIPESPEYLLLMNGLLTLSTSVVNILHYYYGKYLQEQVIASIFLWYPGWKTRIDFLPNPLS